MNKTQQLSFVHPPHIGESTVFALQKKQVNYSHLKCHKSKEEKAPGESVFVFLPGGIFSPACEKSSSVLICR